MTSARATSVTLGPADAPSVLTLASARLNFAISGWLRSEPMLKRDEAAALPLLPHGVALVRSWEAERGQEAAISVCATPDTRVSVSFVPALSSMPEGAACESLVELLTLTMNGCSLGPPGSFFHTPSSVLHIAAHISLSNIKIQLHGPSGVGKTHLVRSICGALRLHFFPLSLVSLLALPDPAQPLARLFATVRQHTPAVVLLEDLDAASVIEESTLLATALPPLLSGLGALLDVPRTFVIGEARELDHLPASIRNVPWLGRRVEMPLPTPAQRAALLSSLLAVAPAAPLQAAVRTAAYRSAGFLPRDLVRLASLARDLARGTDVTAEHLANARALLPPSQLADYLPSMPDVTWSDVGGSGEIQRAFREAFEWPHEHSADLSRLGVVPPSGILLYGPSGCGKTLAVYALANTVAVNFLTVKGPELFSKYLGDTERTVRKLFARARKMAPCIVFFDELDAIGARRGGGDDGESGVSERVLTQLLTEMDGIADKKRVTVIGCTNRPELIDNETARKDIIRVLSRRTALHPSVDVEALAARLEGYTGADIAALLREAALEALSADKSSPCICSQHLEAALLRVNPFAGGAPSEAGRGRARFAVTD